MKFPCIGGPLNGSVMRVMGNETRFTCSHLSSGTRSLYFFHDGEWLFQDFM